MRVLLPNGFFDGPDYFNVAFIDELRGKQQNYLADKDLVVGNVGHIPKILCDLIQSVQTESGLTWKGNIEELVYKLPAGDIQTLLIKIRENTYGSKFYLEVTCPHCQHVDKNLKLELNKLEISPMSIEDLTNVSNRSLTLPKSQLPVELKPLYLKDIFEILRITKGSQKELVTSVTALSIKRLGDKDKVTPKDIDDISVSDLMFLKEKMENTKLEGTIDTKIEHSCSSCGKDFESQLDVLSADFFDHTRGYTN